MDTTILVDELFEKGKKLIETLDNKGLIFPIALLIKFPEKENWILLFGVPGLIEQGAVETFTKIQNVIKESGIDFSLSELALDDVNSPLLSALKMMISTGQGIGKITFFGNAINGQVFPDSIIYRCKN